MRRPLLANAGRRSVDSGLLAGYLVAVSWCVTMPQVVAAEPSDTQAASTSAASDSASAARDRYERASRLAESGRLAEAAELLSALVKQYADRADVWNNLGVVYARQGRLAKAGQALRRATNAPDSLAMTERNLGDVYLALARRAYVAAGPTADPRIAALDQLLPALAGDGASAMSRTTLSDTPRQPEVSFDDATREMPSASNELSPRSFSPATTEADAETEAITHVLQARARARQAGDFEAWLAAYSDDYRPDDSQSRVGWLESSRAQFLAHQPSAPVHVAHVTTQRGADGRVIAAFDEQTDGRAHAVRAEFVLEDGHWRIHSGG